MHNILTFNNVIKVTIIAIFDTYTIRYFIEAPLLNI